MRPILPILRLLVLTLIVIAAARPQAGEAEEIINQEGVDIAIALDISGSMASLDFQPQNRLEASKQVIGEFIAQRKHDRIGLVVFARDAFVQSPPTLNADVLKFLVDEVQLASDLRLEEGSAIGLGLASAANMLKDSSAESKVIILLTDGVNTSGEVDPTTAAVAIESLGIKVHTIGMGREGMVPIIEKDILGERIVFRESELDQEALLLIAETTGGTYFQAEDTGGLQQIYDQIDDLEKSQIEISSFVRYQELAMWLIIPALALLVLELILRNTIFRKIP